MVNLHTRIKKLLVFVCFRFDQKFPPDIELLTVLVVISRLAGLSFLFLWIPWYLYLFLFNKLLSSTLLSWPVSVIGLTTTYFFKTVKKNFFLAIIMQCAYFWFILIHTQQKNYRYQYLKKKKFLGVILQCVYFRFVLIHSKNKN